MKKDQSLMFLRGIWDFITIKANLLIYAIILSVAFFLVQFNILDNNIANYTWIYSTSMQVLGALIALLPISYSFYLSRIDEQQDGDIDKFVIQKLKKDGYYDLMFVIMFNVIAIIVNLIYLFLVFKSSYAIFAALMTLVSVQYVVIFIYRLFDPDRVRNILKEFDSSTVISPDQKQVSLDEFITQYLTLETSVKDYISNENDNEMIDKLALYDIVDNLSKDFAVIESFNDDFTEIIFHRNNVIHNYTDVVVDYSKYIKIKELIKVFQNYNDEFIAEKIFSNVSTIKNIIGAAIDDFLKDYRNLDFSNPVKTGSSYEEIMSSLFSTYFVNDYFETLEFDKASETDFEIIQNNYSERKLLAIELKMTDSKSFKMLSNNLFKKLQRNYLYLFIINYDLKQNQFEISYVTKGKNIRSYVRKSETTKNDI